MLTKQEHYLSLCPLFGQSWLLFDWPVLQAFSCCWSLRAGWGHSVLRPRWAGMWFLLCCSVVAVLVWQDYWVYSSALWVTFSEMESHIKTLEVCLYSALVKKILVWIDMHLQNNQIGTDALLPTERPAGSCFILCGGFWTHFSPCPCQL